MIRKIIKINEEKCNGCGACAAACHEGAIGMVDGKAKLLREDYCDGLGDCLPTCTVDVIGIVLPLAGLRVLSAIVDGDAEREHLGAGRGGAKLGIAGEVSGDVDSVDAHWLLSFRFRRGADPPAFVAMYVPRCSDA